jgi:hypothetical protein
MLRLQDNLALIPLISISSLTLMKRMTLGELGQFSLVYFLHISHNAMTNLRVEDTDI